MRKELETLKRIREELATRYHDIDDIYKWSAIEDDLDDIEKTLEDYDRIQIKCNEIKLKLLQFILIIKHKNVFYVQKFINSKTLEEYNAYLTEKEQLTQREFDNLKEILK